MFSIEVQYKISLAFELGTYLRMVESFTWKHYLDTLRLEKYKALLVSLFCCQLSEFTIFLSNSYLVIPVRSQMPNTLLAQDNKILKECFYKLLSNDCLVQKAIAPKCLMCFLKVVFFWGPWPI